MALANTRELANVRDAAIRTILEEHLRGQGIDPSKPAPLKPANFTGEHVPRMPSGVPILRVRLIEDSQTIRAVSEERAHQCVKPGSNHHITYFAVVNGDREVWKATVATTLDVAQRAAAGQPLVAPEEYAGGRFLMSLAIGEAFEFDGTDGHRQLCIVRKLDQRSKRVYYRQHDDARPAGDLQKELLYFSVQQMQQRNARKVTLDLLGRVRRAGD